MKSRFENSWFTIFFNQGPNKIDYMGIVYVLIIVLSVFVPTIAEGQNMNLTGNLNINDTQIASTSNLLLSLVVTLAESIIPIIVGAVVGHKSINHWLEKKDRLIKKNTILENYSHGLKGHIDLLDGFVNRVFRSYIIFQKDSGPNAAKITEYCSPEHGIEGFLQFPPTPGELPAKRFVEDYRRLVSKIEETALSKDRLRMGLRFFQNGGSGMDGKVLTITSTLTKAELLIARFLQSSNGVEFTEFHSKYRKLSDGIKNEMGGLELELIRLGA